MKSGECCKQQKTCFCCSAACSGVVLSGPVRPGAARCVAAARQTPSGPLITPSVTQTIRPVPPRCSAAELRSVRIKGWRPLKARPPVQSPRPCSALMWFAENQSADLFYGLCRFTRSRPSAPLERLSGNKRLRLQRQGLRVEANSLRPQRRRVRQLFTRIPAQTLQTLTSESR